MDQIQNKKPQYETILITGGAGFVGSNLSVCFKKEYPYSRILAFDNLRRRGSELNIPRLRENGVEFFHGDIRYPEDLELGCKVDLLLECSAEPSVLAGYGESPQYLIDTNLVGAINCLEVARKNRADVIFFSTSRVYPYEAINNIRAVEDETRFEWSEIQDKDIPGWSKDGINADFTLIGPKTMYGATKLCAEILLQEYIRMYGLRGIINRCGVITGPWQFGKIDQGVVSLWVASHIFQKDLSYIGFGGTGKQVRDFIHVEDLFRLLQLQLEQLDSCSGETFNVGGGKKQSFSLLELTKVCEEVIGNRIRISPVLENRHGDIRIYLSDYRKVQKLYDWEPRIDLVATIEGIVKWIKDQEKSLLYVLCA